LSQTGPGAVSMGESEREVCEAAAKCVDRATNLTETS
jgi:hypothetical protein